MAHSPSPTPPRDAPAPPAPAASVTASAGAPTASIPDRSALLRVLRDPQGGESLSLQAGGLTSADGRRHWPIVRGIPRFVPADDYAASFGFEWNLHDTTQIDSVQSTKVSEQVLRDKTGLGPDDVRGRLVLDAGCGAGRFAEVLLDWGATVVAVDLSSAVDAAARHVGSNPRALLVQADIGSLPFAPGTFDAIVSIGVLHHTPDTRTHFLKLPPLLKPGGTIAIWVYPDEGEYRRRLPWIPVTSRVRSRWFHGFCKVLVTWMRRHPRHPMSAWIQQIFPISSQSHGLENDMLDTFDGYSPRYHGVHGAEQVMGWFREAGLEDVESLPIATSVRGRRPRS